MIYRFVVVFIFFMKITSAQVQSNVFRQGFRIAIFTNDLVNKKYEDPFFTLNSNNSLCYELGYVLRTNTKLFLETGINSGLNTMVFTSIFNDPANDFYSKDKTRSYDFFYTKFPVSLGYNAKIRDRPFQFKVGINFSFMKPGTLRTGISSINSAGVYTQYFTNKFEINYKEYVYKSASVSLGHYIHVFKRNTLLMELNLTYFPQDIGDYYFEAYPDDPRYVLIRGKLEDNWNFGLNLTYLL